MLSQVPISPRWGQAGQGLRERSTASKTRSTECLLYHPCPSRSSHVAGELDGEARCSWMRLCHSVCALLWVMHREGVLHTIHYFDDFLFIRSPSSSQRSSSLSKALQVCAMWSAATVRIWQWRQHSIHAMQSFPQSTGYSAAYFSFLHPLQHFS